MGIPVVIKTAGGMPVTVATSGYGVPMTVATNGFGIAVTQAANGLAGERHHVRADAAIDRQ